MYSIHQRVEQLEAENRELKAQLAHFSEVAKQNEQILTVEKERLQALGDNFPNGTLFRLKTDIATQALTFDYVSGTWEKVFGVSAEKTLADIYAVLNRIDPADLPHLMLVINESARTMCNVNMEIRYHYTDNSLKWLQMASYPHRENDTVYFDGFILDVTNRRHVDNELVLYRENLERLVQEKTIEVASVNEELTATNEELETINRELKNTNDELLFTNDELSLYRTQLEQMVEIKTREQSIIIKVLQIMQLPIDIPDAINAALAEIGEYTGMSRVYILENDSTNKSLCNTYEWCNHDIESVMNFSQQISIKALNEWYHIFERNGYVYIIEDAPLKPVAALEGRGSLPLLAVPLVTNGVHYGILGFDECIYDRQLNKNEIDVFISLSRIIANNVHRYRAESAINLSQQTMHTVLDNNNATIMVIDLESYEILYANKTMKYLMGDVEGHVCWQIIQEGMTGPCDFCPNRRLRDSNKRPTGPFQWEYRNTKDHEWYSCNGVAIEWVDGRLVHLEYANNITQLKNTEIAMIEAKEKAEESDRLKSAFLANMSHEIRTPLNCITGFLKFLEDENLSLTRRREYINIVNGTTEQFIRLVDDIVDVSTIEAGQMNLYPVAFRLNEFMEEIFTFFDSWLHTQKKPRTALVIDRSRFIDNCICFIDAARLRQTINNLIDNAFKFLDKGYVCFGYRQKGPDILEFVVEDTGVGIPESHQKAIFERFRQGKSDKRLRGTGLGLAISRSLAQMMGGNIRVESTENMGSTFYVTVAYLPVTHDDEYIFDPFRKTQGSTSRPFTGKTALLFESLDMKYVYYEKMLSEAGFSVVRTDVQQWHDFADMVNKTDVVVVSLSETGNTEHNITGHSKTPVIYIVPDKLYDYYFLTQNNPYSMIITEPVNFSALSKALKKIMK